MHCLFLFALAQPARTDAQPQQRPLEFDIQDIIDDTATNNAWWGVYAVDLNSGEAIYADNAGRSFIPASGTKLYTTAAALDLLGPDYRYKTQLFADGAIERGVLSGNLIVRGAGDPSLGSVEFDQPPTHVFHAWADSLHAAGVTRVAGDIIGDDNIFDDTPLGNSWAWDDEVYGYSAQASGLSFHDNAVNVAIAAREYGESAAVTWSPAATSYVTVLNATRTIARGAALKEGYDRAQGTNRIELSSEVPVGRIDKESIAVHNPTLFFVHALREVLIDRGISVGGTLVDVDDLSIRPNYPALRRLATYLSPPLADLVTVINKHSQNLYAELVLRTIGTEHPVDDEDLDAGSAEMGIAAAMETFLAAGIDTSRLQLVDGSGLSRMNLATPAMTVQLLQFMAGHADTRVRSTFENSLAVGGQSGTLEHRLRSVSARVRAKTGSLGNVSSLSGYLDTRKGRHLAFSIVCNHFTVPTRTIRRAQDRIVTALVLER